MDNEPEIWKTVVGYEGTYELSSAWRVRRIAGGQGARPGRILKQFLDNHGYLRVNLCRRGEKTSCLIHRLIADAFLPTRGPTDMVVRHLNDDPTDNRIENLAWGTYSDNGQDATRNCKWNLREGTANGRAKLTEDIVREIRRLYATGEFSQRELGLKFGVSQYTICQIVRRETWQYV